MLCRADMSLDSYTASPHLLDVLFCFGWGLRVSAIVNDNICSRLGKTFGCCPSNTLTATCYERYFTCQWHLLFHHALPLYYYFPPCHLPIAGSISQTEEVGGQVKEWWIFPLAYVKENDLRRQGLTGPWTLWNESRARG